MRVRSIGKAIGTICIAALVAAGCGSDSDDSNDTSGSAKTETTKAAAAFGTPQLVAKGGSDPDLAFGDDGTIYLSWVQPAGGADSMEGMEGMDHEDAAGDDHSHDDGASEGTGTTGTTDAVDTEGAPLIRADHDGEDESEHAEHAEGTESTEGDDADHTDGESEGEGHDMSEMTTFDAYLATSTDGGKTFGEPVRVNDVEGDVFSGANTQPKITLAGDRVLVSYTRSRDYPGQEYGQYTVRVSESTDGGKTFAKARDLLSEKTEGEVTSESYQELHALEDGTIVAAVLDYRGSFRKPAEEAIGVRTTTWKAGEDWFGKSVLVDEQSCECCDNSLTSTKDGKVLLAYRDQLPNGDKKPIRDSASRSSTDQGATWSEPVKLGDDKWEYDQCPESGPDITVDGEGNVHGLYYTGKEGRPGVYHTFSDDEGESFEAGPLATAKDFFPPAAMDVAALDAGALAAWDDSRTDDTKVGYAIVGKDGDVKKTPDFAEGSTPSVAALDGHMLLAFHGDDGIMLATSGTHDHAGGSGDSSGGTETSTTADGDEVDAEFDVTVKGGAVEGGPQAFKVDKGDTVRIKITSDEADEVHVHGVDISRDIPAGGTTTVTFEADTQGSYEVELHESGALLGTLEVR